MRPKAPTTVHLSCYPIPWRFFKDQYRVESYPGEIVRDIFGIMIMNLIVEIEAAKSKQTRWRFQSLYSTWSKPMTEKGEERYTNVYLVKYLPLFKVVST